MSDMRRAPRDTRQRVGVVEVARCAGVSTATVSRVLNGVGQVSADTRRRVEEVVKTLDYAPNNFARALASQRSMSIGVIVPSLRGSIFAPGLEAIQGHAGTLGYSVVIGCSDYDMDRELDLARSFATRGVDGLILVGLLHHPELRPTLARRGIPYVCQGAYRRRSEHPCVGFDNRKVMQRVASYLLDLGHRRFGVIAGIAEGNDRVQERVIGIREALAARGVPLPDDAVIEARYDLAEARRVTRRLLALTPRPTAIFCINDVLAHGAILECAAQGVAVPEAISVIGFDDLDFAAHVRPAISTLRVPTAEMGARAMDLLLAQIEKRPRLRLAREIETELVVRGSTAPPPAR
jgi:LacI family transcriptional regulator, galactose operon repressor